MAKRAGATPAFDQELLGPPAEELTLALALTETVTLADAEVAATTWALHDRASTPRFAPTCATVPAAWTASFPLVWIAARIAGKFFVIVVCSAVSCDDAVPVHERLAEGGVHDALAFTWLWHWAWHCALALHEGGVTCPSHFGAVAVPVQPPLHVAVAPQLTEALPVILQSPLHVPLQVPPQ